MQTNSIGQLGKEPEMTAECQHDAYHKGRIERFFDRLMLELSHKIPGTRLVAVYEDAKPLTDDRIVQWDDVDIDGLLHDLGIKPGRNTVN